MNVLLDTHVFLWVLACPGRLQERNRALIADPANGVFVSAVSGWEIQVKRMLGKLEAPDNLEEELGARRILPLPLEFLHTSELRRLPPLHGDPFDRMLIAQARVEGMPLMTADRKIMDYEVSCITA